VPVVRAAAEALPFPDNSFDVALALMTVHHWKDLRRGLAELRRVAARQVVFTFDPAMHDSLWVHVRGAAPLRRVRQPQARGAIADYLDCPLGASETLRFSEGNLFVRVLENVRGRDVFLVQGTGAFPANDNFMELLFWIDAFKRASAASVTAVMPYFSYAKGDKKDEPRVSIRARVCADAIEAAGVDRVITLDLHAPQVQGFFKVPVDDLYALPSCATPSPPRDSRTSSSSPPTPGSPRRPASGRIGSTRRWPSPTSGGWTTPSRPRSSSSSVPSRAARR
jgi:SAM-dependent methyltransferase